MIGYRPEIDGLRAVAIISVLLFHAGFGFTSGGFVGVDVFFVISGYLITSIILKELSTDNKFSYLNFYERRARRLVPPFVPVLAFALIGAFVLFPEDQLKNFIKNGYAALLFVSNWYLLSTVNYFGGPGEYTPLLHTWSLSVEEQFYFIFPTLLVFLYKKNQSKLIWACTILAALSFGYAVFLTHTHKVETAFYSSIPRFWELMIGATLAASKFKAPKTQSIADILEVSGILLIAYAAFTYSSQTLFPGLSALIPTVGTAMIIAAAGKGRLVSPVLKTKTLVGIGLISYGLYLWHWPVLVFIRTITPVPSPWILACGIGFSAICAALSYRYLETPIRRRIVFGSARNIFGFATAVIIGFIVFASIGKSSKIESFRDTTQDYVRTSIYGEDRKSILIKLKNDMDFYQANLNKNFTGEDIGYNSSLYDGWTCSYDKNNTIGQIETCLESQAKGRNVLVIGDSIGRDSLHALRIAYPKINFIMLHQSSCPPGENVSSNCFMKLGEILTKIKKTVKPEAVVLNFRYRPTDWRNVEPGIAAAKMITNKVFMLGVSPMYSKELSEYVKTLKFNETPPVFVTKENKEMSQWDYRELAVKAKKMAEDNSITFVNVLDFFCPNQNCRLWIGDKVGTPLMFDQQHLTDAGIHEYANYLKSVAELQNL
jgi:peptidoglycan/LPS O-acetylase OafA/YrhL